jgi:hypothetical protein
VLVVVVGGGVEGGFCDLFLQPQLIVIDFTLFMKPTSIINI